MEQDLFDVLSELEIRAETERLRGVADGMAALDPDSAKLVSLLAISKNARNIVEVGSGVGYSTLWLAYAASTTGGKVVSCEIDPTKADETRANLAKAGLTAYVDVLTGDARELLRHQEESVDFLFIDGEYGQYETYFDVVYKRMGVGSAVMASLLSTERTMMISPNSLFPSSIPVPLSLKSTAKAWKGFSPVISSSTITVAFRTKSTLSGVTSPTTRVANPGPGNGIL